MAVVTHLTLGDRPMPIEYLELILCRDVYHCTPNELDAQDMERVGAHLVCLRAEAKCKNRG